MKALTVRQPYAWAIIHVGKLLQVLAGLFDRIESWVARELSDTALTSIQANARADGYPQRQISGRSSFSTQTTSPSPEKLDGASVATAGSVKMLSSCQWPSQVYVSNVPVLALGRGQRQTQMTGSAIGVDPTSSRPTVLRRNSMTKSLPTREACARSARNHPTIPAVFGCTSTIVTKLVSSVASSVALATGESGIYAMTLSGVWRQRSIYCGHRRSRWATANSSRWTSTSPGPPPEPIPCKGALGLWTVPAEVEAQLLAGVR